MQQQTLARLPAPEDDAIEIDELCLRKAPALWVWLAVSRRTRQVLGFVIGDHTAPMLKQALADVPTDYWDKPVYTDHWGAYARFFPASQHHACDKGSGLTSIVEGLNTKWRQRQSANVFPTFGSAEDGAEGNDENFHQKMASCAGNARVSKVGKVHHERRQGHGRLLQAKDALHFTFQPCV